MRRLAASRAFQLALLVMSISVVVPASASALDWDCCPCFEKKRPKMCPACLQNYGYHQTSWRRWGGPSETFDNGHFEMPPYAMPAQPVFTPPAAPVAKPYGAPGHSMAPLPNTQPSYESQIQPSVPSAPSPPAASAIQTMSATSLRAGFTGHSQRPPIRLRQPSAGSNRTFGMGFRSPLGPTAAPNPTVNYRSR